MAHSIETNSVEHPRRARLFYGHPEESFLEFLDDFEMVAHIEGWDAARKVRMLPGYLREAAERKYLELPQPTRDDWALLRQALTDTFLSPSTTALFHLALSTWTQEPGESVTTYATDVEQLVQNAYPTVPTQHRLPYLHTAFMTGLRPDMKLHVLTTQPTATYEQAFSLAKNFEFGRKLYGGVNGGNASSSGNQVYVGFVVNDPQKSIFETVDRLSKQVEALTMKPEVYAAHHRHRGSRRPYHCHYQQRGTSTPHWDNANPSNGHQVGNQSVGNVGR